MRKKSYYTVIDTITDLQARGFIFDFSLISSKLFCAQGQYYLEPEEFEVLERYRFYSHERTRDQTDIYALESTTRPLKGILLNSGNRTSLQAIQLVFD
jgi:hypothetical protein